MKAVRKKYVQLNPVNITPLIVHIRLISTSGDCPGGLPYVAMGKYPVKVTPFYIKIRLMSPNCVESVWCRLAYLYVHLSFKEIPRAELSQV